MERPISPLARPRARFDHLALLLSLAACGSAPPYASKDVDSGIVYWSPKSMDAGATSEPAPPVATSEPSPAPANEPVPGAPPDAPPSNEQEQALRKNPPKPIVGAPRTDRPALGVNIGGVDYFSRQIMFLDLMKQALDWGLNSGGLMPKLDKNGWPRGLVPGHRAGFVANAGKGGRYVILYDGVGTMSVANGDVVSQDAGRYVVQLNGGETHFTIETTDSRNPLRNIRIVPIENEKNHEQELFHPKFLALVKPFGVLRFMDYTHTNMSKQARWSDRATPEYFSQGTERGAAIEYALALCNRVQADCWLNIPHMADDDYVRHFAELVRDQLDPKLRAYIEYSNEVWNFSHGDWIQQAGERAGLPKEWDTRLRYQARRSVQIFNIFEKTLGRQRLVRVLAGQCWDLRLSILLDFEKAYEHADAVAIAPYFGYEVTEDSNVPKIKTASAQQVMESTIQGIDAQRALLKQLKKIADDRKLPLIGYEGGQHLATGGQFHADERLQKMLDDVNRNPRMAEAYKKYLELWRDEGGQMMVLYKLVDEFSKWGRWGLLEDMWQPLGSAPKYMATLAFLQKQPRWWSEAPKASK